jgi:predicted acetyltransferase
MALQSGTICPNDRGMPDSALTSFRSVIELWDSRDSMATEVGGGVNRSQVSKWWKRDNIPSEYWASVLRAPRVREAGVSADLLTSLAAREEARA